MRLDLDRELLDGFARTAFVELLRAQLARIGDYDMKQIAKESWAAARLMMEERRRDGEQMTKPEDWESIS